MPFLHFLGKISDTPNFEISGNSIFAEIAGSARNIPVENCRVQMDSGHSPLDEA